MKKVRIAILSMILLLGLAVPAMAVGSVGLTVSSATIHRGDTFTVTVSVSGVGACRSGGIEVSCDSQFELTGGDWLIDGAILSDFSVSSKDGVFALDSARTLSGKVFKLTFKAKSDAKFTAGSISVKLSLAGGDTISHSVKVTVSCDHKYGSWSSTGDAKHSRKCSICGATDSQSHSYDHGCDTDCNACGAVRTTTHSFGTEWLSDETGHWHACQTCGEKSEFAEHIPGAPAGEYTDQTCTVCAYVITPALGHTHKYDGTYLTDAYTHWTKCTGCGEETEAQMHSFDDGCDDICDACGYQRAVLHQESEVWLTTVENHWKVCQNCQTHLQEGSHIWDGGTVIQTAALNQTGKMEYRCGVCEATRVADIPALTLTQALDWWVWLAMGAGGGILVTVMICLLIILPKTMRKSKGRFSE